MSHINTDILIIMFMTTSILFVVEIGVLTYILSSVAKNYNRNKELSLSVEKYGINCNIAPFSDDINLDLEKFINDCFDDYKVKFLLPDKNGNRKYVNDEEEIKIRNDLVDIVSSRISPFFLERLSIYYNENSIGSIIADKIYLIVMNYTIESRLMISDREEGNSFQHLPLQNK